MESIKTAVAGAFLRPWIRRQLGKDWYESLTIWGLVLHESASTLVNEACTLGALDTAFCSDAIGFLETVGKVLIVVGIRRKKSGD
jgi:hypothetical protein